MLKLHLNRIKVAHVRQPTPSNYFNVVTRAPEIVSTSTGMQIIHLDIYTQEIDTDSVECSELCSKDIISNEEKHEDTHSPKSSLERMISEIETYSQMPNPLTSVKIETQSQTPIPLKSVEIETHEKSPNVIQEPVLRAETQIENDQLLNLWPKPTIRKLNSYCDSDLIDLKDLSESSDNEFYKIKCVLAQRPTAAGLEYLVHFAGEPAQNMFFARNPILSQNLSILKGDRNPNDKYVL